MTNIPDKKAPKLGFATGGFVKRGLGAPVRLTGGLCIVCEASVDLYGHDLLNQLNSRLAYPSLSDELPEVGPGDSDETKP